MNQEKIGKFIAKMRKEKNMTQVEMANKLGITDRAVSKWENGRGLPDISLLKNLSQILDISITELLSGEKNSINKTENIIIDTLNTNQKQAKKIAQGNILLGCSVAFGISTIVFGAMNQMVVTFGGITIGFILAGMITLFRKV